MIRKGTRVITKDGNHGKVCIIVWSKIFHCYIALVDFDYAITSYVKRECLKREDKRK
jgi:hypothetical protein